MTGHEGVIPVAGPWIDERDVAAVAEAARTAWYERSGEPVAEFEQRFAEHTGRRHAIALPSCTAGIHLLLAALGVGAGDDVVVPDATWIATSAPISYVGANPRFADVDARTWCLTPGTLERVLTPRTRVVIAVDLYGSMPPMDDLATVCAERDVVLLEDAAEAVGSSIGGRPAGSFGLASVFSFHGSKTLTTGEGGMVVTDDAVLHERMLVLRDHGRPPGDVDFYNEEVGFKYKMSALQAALGAAQLTRVDELVEKKRTIFGWYRDRLGDFDGVTLNAEPPGTRNSYWMTTVVLDDALGVSERDLAGGLRQQGVATRPFFHPLSSLTAYANAPDASEDRDRNRVAAHLGAYGINLPSALRLEQADVERVCSLVRQHLERSA